MSQIWKFIPAGLAHELGPIGLTLYAEFCGKDIPEWNPFRWRNLIFQNRLGIAGGVDKNADLLHAWPRLGPGFIEIGTVTPRPQGPNPGKIVDRDWEHKNLWNKMGFPNVGAKEVQMNLARAWENKKTPWLINIGKNRVTPNENAVSDYLEALSTLCPYGDIFVLNVSSPNTTGLRALQAKDQLQKITDSLVCYLKEKPLLIKLSPDLNPEELQSSLEAGVQSGASGFILTNTTLARPPDCPFPKEGGLSGKDLKEKSLHTLRDTIQALGKYRKDLLLISTGGIMTPQDVQERLALGADLVQLYSAMVFEGPGIFHQISHFMKDLPPQKRTT